MLPLSPGPCANQMPFLLRHTPGFSCIPFLIFSISVTCLKSSLVDMEGSIYFGKAQEGWTLQLLVYCAPNFKCSLRFPGLWLRELFLFSAHSEPADTRWKYSETGTDGTALSTHFCVIPVIVRTLLGGCSCCSAKLPLLGLGLFMWWFTCAAVVPNVSLPLNPSMWGEHYCG